MHVSHYWHVHHPPAFVRLAATVLVACALAFVSLPVSGASAVTLATEHGTPGGLRVDSGAVHAASAGRSRRASFAWRGHAIRYTESIPSKWDWSLSTAIAKWNTSGGGIRFVRAAKPRKARLTISYGNIGGAAGMASVGKSRHAFVRLSSAYSSMDATNARNRVQVVGIFAHELGHVLGFEHTSARCSLMSPVLDVDGCQVLPATMPGYYKCRTIDSPLLTRFVQIYGGHARTPSAYCPIDPLPSAVSQVAVVGGDTSPVTVTWGRPAFAPPGSRVVIRSWTAPLCGSVPATADTAYAAVGTRAWHGSQFGAGGTQCYNVRLVNRYGAGGPAVSRLMRF